jgi:3-deoxy-D-manno-octulosonic-acid transferase
MTMLIYSALLSVALVLSSPWWLLRMGTTQRYREGLRQRLGGLPLQLRGAVQGKRVVWVHAVSVGEVLAASRLVSDLEAALGEGFRIVISTTTRTGQTLARERFGTERVFYMPLDFAFAVRTYLAALKPAALILMESELWPRMLHECARRGVPVAVVNARMSDRSHARAIRMRRVWGHVMRKPALWLAQSDEDARRLLTVGVRAETMKVVGNLKYDVRAPKQGRVAELIREIAAGRPIIVAGSTVADGRGARAEGEEEAVIQAWSAQVRKSFGTVLVLAPRHPERFAIAELRAKEFLYAKASHLISSPTGETLLAANRNEPIYAPVALGKIEIVLLDTVGDLAAVYGIATIAFVGGSLVKRGGHNPLEPAQFDVPVIMGPSFENFRDVVAKMQDASAIRIVKNKDELEKVFIELLTHPEDAKALGERGRQVFEEQQGATARTVEALIEMIQGAKP